MPPRDSEPLISCPNRLERCGAQTGVASETCCMLILEAVSRNVVPAGRHDIYSPIEIRGSEIRANTSIPLKGVLFPENREIRLEYSLTLLTHGGIRLRRDHHGALILP